jgi:CHASE1-domain containing sensor protein
VKKLNGLSGGILVVSLSITFLVWIGFANSLTNTQNHDFQSDANFMTLLISDELEQYEQVLVGAEGLFAATNSVSLSGWESFVEIQDIKTRFPGLQGVGYVQHTLHEDRGKLIAEMKSYGSDEYDIKPAGDRDEYYPVLFLEPLDLRNQQAIGYDIYFEQTRKNTVNTLIETGDTTITGKIILVQEIDEDVQNGFLMLVPVYSNSNPDSLKGIVYTVFRINDFVAGTVDDALFEHLRLKIYDNFVSDENQFFNSDSITHHEFEDSVYHSHYWIFYECIDVLFI